MGYGHVIEGYLKEVLSKEPTTKKGSKGLSVIFFNWPIAITTNALLWASGEEVPEQISVIVLRYVSYQGKREAKAHGDWVGFRDLKDSMPFQGAFQNNVESRLERYFKGRLRALSKACEDLGGINLNLNGFDLAYEFLALPDVKIRLLFNDSDEILPPKAKVLFSKDIERYLDVECIAALGWVFVDMLVSTLRVNKTFV